MKQLSLNSGQGKDSYMWYRVLARMKLNDLQYHQYSFNCLASSSEDATYLCKPMLPTGAVVVRISLVGMIGQYENYVGYEVFDPTVEAPKVTLSLCDFAPDGLNSDTLPL